MNTTKHVRRRAPRVVSYCREKVWAVYYLVLQHHFFQNVFVFIHPGLTV
jgi:hypothetical protein